ncbi:MAG TPA: hypothetical protein VFB80_13580 [Pirellulaceae bacterium]|nr:hypothetical protein [Pirellulaceae bacterium]
MSAALKLPPSERDFEVFFKVMFHSVSTWRTAEFFNISQTRVRQLVTLVGDWVADHLPDVGETDLQKQVRLAQHVAANRLEHQYEQVMALWTAEYNPKYLRQATRIALAQARLGLVTGRIHALAADVTAGPLELGDEIPPVDAHSPNRDCSPAASNGAGGRAEDAEEIAASDGPEQMIERERYQRLRSVEGCSLMENRLLTLIANQGSHNPEKVAELEETLSRVRAEKATAELRLSRYVPGVQIAPLDVPREAALQ